MHTISHYKASGQLDKVQEPFMSRREKVESVVAVVFVVATIALMILAGALLQAKP